MHYSENIGRILRLFREDRTERSMEHVSNFDLTVKNKIISELLLNSCEIGTGSSVAYLAGRILHSTRTNT